MQTVLNKKDNMHRCERMNWENIQTQWSELNNQITEYFSDLSTNEQYAWITETIGIVLLLAGLILLVL